MKKLSLLVVFAAFIAGCAQDTKNLEKKVDELAKNMDEIKGMLKAGAGTGGGARGDRRQQQRPPRPTADPAKTYSVNVDGSPFEGPVDALVTIVKAYEYACPFCEKVRPTMSEITKKYGKDVRFVYKQYVVHPQVATSTALAARAAHKQGKFLQMDEGLWEKVFKARKFDKDRCWAGGTAEAGGAGGCENVDAIAKEIGLDLDKFRADMKDSCMSQIQKEQKEMQQVGVGATPAFFVNGRFVSGAQPFEAFAALIDDELKKARDRVGSGTPQASYYKTWVVDKGEKQAEVK
jgi:protein-disulfide isomerase